jgi:DNA-binding LacI/PurR family transcriptional regulator
MTVGMAFHDLTSMLGMELLSALTSGLDEAGYSVFISTAQGQDDKFDQLVNRFLQRRVDALVCVHPRGSGAALEGFASAGIPVMALISKGDGYANLPLVGPTVISACNDAIHRLQALGHAAIAVVMPDRLTNPLRDLLKSADDLGMPARRYPVDDTVFDPKVFLEGWRADATAPKVIVARQADAQRLLDAAVSLGIAVPRDLSIVSIRDRSIVAVAQPMALSTIHLNPRLVGQAAAGLLKAWLAGGPAVTGEQRIDMGSWVERDTTGQAPR